VIVALLGDCDKFIPVTGESGGGGGGGGVIVALLGDCDRFIPVTGEAGGGGGGGAGEAGAGVSVTEETASRFCEAQYPPAAKTITVIIAPRQHSPSTIIPIVLPSGI
jgi:hypothetical protein